MHVVFDTQPTSGIVFVSHLRSRILSTLAVFWENHFMLSYTPISCVKLPCVSVFAGEVGMHPSLYVMRHHGRSSISLHHLHFACRPILAAVVSTYASPCFVATQPSDVHIYPSNRVDGRGRPRAFVRIPTVPTCRCFVSRWATKSPINRSHGSSVVSVGSCCC